MGTFIGHALPGSFFLIFAIWWATQLPRRWVVCKAKGIPFINTLAYPMPWRCCSKLPIEGIIKVVATSIGMAAEMSASTRFEFKKVWYYGDVQHVTMYGLFWVYGWMDILVGMRSTRWCVPRGVDYLAAALAFCGEWVLFRYHLHGRDQLDILLHTTLLFVLEATIVVLLLECYIRNNPLIAFVRIYLVMLQGTWFYQVGFILYPFPSQSPWEPNNPDHLMMAVMVLTWHMAIIFLIMCFMFVGLSYLYRTSCAIKELDCEADMIEAGLYGDEQMPDGRHGGLEMVKLGGSAGERVRYSMVGSEDAMQPLVDESEDDTFTNPNFKQK